MDKILVVEDDTYINNMLNKLLKLNNYEVISAYSGTEAILLHNNTISLILLDLMLPGKNGEEIIGKLKTIANVPIIVISAIADPNQKVNLFELGADDYITKPFDNGEVLARIKVQIKHKQKNNNNTFLRFKDIEMNSIDYTVRCNNKEVQFTKNEFNLLKVLMEHPNQVLTKSMLFDLVWSDEDSADDNTLNVHISKIRNKLKEANPLSEYIETIWGIGYKLKN